MKKLSFFLFALLLVSPTSVSASTTVYTDTGVEVEVETVGDVSIQSETSAEANGTSASGEVEIDLDAPIPYTNDPNVLMQASAGVVSVEFDTFIEEIENNNADVADVRSEESGAITVEYEHQGKLFWVIPVTLTSQTTVEADTDGNARVTVTMPWWSFLVDRLGDVRASVENRIAASTDAGAGVKTDASTSSRIHLVEVIVSSLKANAQAHADTSAEVE